MTSALLPMSLQEKKGRCFRSFPGYYCRQIFSQCCSCRLGPCGLTTTHRHQCVCSASAVQNPGLIWDLRLLYASIWALKMWAVLPRGLSELFCLFSCFKAADNHKKESVAEFLPSPNQEKQCSVCHQSIFSLVPESQSQHLSQSEGKVPK